MHKLMAPTIGRGGLVSPDNKTEGDGCTPLGTYPLREIWVRPDRVQVPVSGLPIHEITADDCWCDDAEHVLYNKHFKLLQLGEEQNCVSEPHALKKSEECFAAANSPHQLSTDSQASLRKLASPLKGEEKSGPQYPQKHVTHAKQLRQNATNAEKKLWYRIRNKQINGHKFRRQQPIGSYIVDFVCQSQKLIIELDGGQHNEAGHQTKDKKRDNYLNTKGYRVLRFWIHEVLQNIEGVLEIINLQLNSTSPLEGEASFLSDEGALIKLVRAEAILEPSSFERLWRDDHAYDVIVVIGYNDDPIIAGKGSAIFMHCVHDDGRPTAGCVALKRNDLLALVRVLSPASSIRICKNGVSII